MSLVEFRHLYYRRSSQQAETSFSCLIVPQSPVLSTFQPALSPSQLDGSNKPIVEFEWGNNGKQQKRHRSLRSFKLRLGLGLVEDSSGDFHQWTPGGSSL